jgi:protein-cysteine N-palmitoyltransferase HHAT
LLSPGWIPGRKVDNSDSQYSSFRDNLPYLFILLFAHPILRKFYNARFPIQTPLNGKSSDNSPIPFHTAEADARLNQRVGYDFAFALIFLCALHGFSIIKILIILSANYVIAKKFPTSYVVPLTWLFNITTLFANEICKGYPYASIANDTFPWTVADPNSNWGTFFDTHSGLMPRWEILFNITVLRLISFNMDYHWSNKPEGGYDLLLEVRYGLTL